MNLSVIHSFVRRVSGVGRWASPCRKKTWPATGRPTPYVLCPTAPHHGIVRVLLMLPALLLALAFSPSPAQVRVDDQRDQIAGLLIELEQARQLRDLVLARRWDDKQRDTEAREQFNREYDELKSALELKNQEADRLHAEIQHFLRDAEEAQAQAEGERVRFLNLSSILRDKARGLAEPIEREFPARVPERLQALNRVLQEADTQRDSPGDILASLVDFLRGELELGREISLERRGFVRANSEPGEGWFLRLGMVTAAYKDELSGQSGLLLKNPAGQFLTPFGWREELPGDAASALDRALTVLEKQSGDVVLLPVDVLLTQNLSKVYTQASDKGFFEAVVDLLKTGGVFMVPLVLVLLLSILLFARKFVQLRRVRAGMEHYEDAAARSERGDTAGVRALHARHPHNLVLRVLEAIGARRAAGRVHSEKAVREIMMLEVPRLERGLTTLAVLAAAAPMLGLLGTISGLIAMFQVITDLGVNDPKLLAGGIGEALVTTEAGLLIAIPVLLGHNFLANRVDDMVAETEYHAAKTLNNLWPGG